MKRRPVYVQLLFLYIPWVLSLLFSAHPVPSYLIAWAGSFLILYLSISGRIVQLPGDLPADSQIMRPLFIPQIIFAGFMACTSIFYFMEVLGYTDFGIPPQYFMQDARQLELVATCQQYYCLGHAALVTGILLNMKYPVKTLYYLKPGNVATFLLLFAIAAIPISFAFRIIPGLSQFSNQFDTLSFIAGTLALAFAIPLKNFMNTAICLVLYAYNFYLALTSGFKEPIIISVLVLGVFLYSFYKKLILATFIPAIFILFMVLPAYNQAFRQNAWNENLDADEAYQSGLDAVLNEDPAEESNWSFLSNRLSEIGLFTHYVETTPTEIDFYGFDLLGQSFLAIVPRIMWPGKPVTEELVMERVYNAGVVNRASNVSAKPQFVADGYLSGGALGVFLSLLLYGAIMQRISIQAEKLFGGYVIGTALIFSGLFQLLWRGLSFEFLINNIFWSYVSMWLIFMLLRLTNLLIRK